ncbi:hypothetical protein [Paenibacillus solani]|uniref:hypothetical protein n=1 Tax=Paenibacillus solani TaxID=1705565 RepID=UPI003D299214
MPIFEYLKKVTGEDLNSFLSASITFLPVIYGIYKFYVRSITSRSLEYDLMPYENRILLKSLKAIISSIIGGLVLVFFGYQTNYLFKEIGLNKEKVTTVLAYGWLIILFVLLILLARIAICKIFKKKAVEDLRKSKIQIVSFWVLYTHLIITFYFASDLSYYLLDYEDTNDLFQLIIEMILFPGYLILVFYFIYIGLMKWLLLKPVNKREKYKIKVKEKGIYLHILYPKNNKVIVLGDKETYEESNNIYWYFRDTKELEEFKKSSK